MIYVILLTTSTRGHNPSLPLSCVTGKVVRDFKKIIILVMNMLFRIATFLFLFAPLAAQKWDKVGLPHPQHSLQLTFAIKQTNTGWLQEKLRAVSYPDSPEYGEYINFDEIAKYVHGRPESVEYLLSLLNSIGVASSEVDFTLGKDFAVVKLPVHSIEKLLSTVLYEFSSSQCSKGNIKVVSSEFPIKLPTYWAPHFDFVSGIHGFPTCEKKWIPSQKLFNSSLHPKDFGVTPETIAKDYNTSNYASTNPSNSQAVAAFLKQYFDPNDLAEFQNKFNIPNKAITKVVGKNVDDDPGAEANLDVQYISATGRGADTWFVSISTYSNGKQEDFVSWITSQVNDPSSPWVHSVSYGDVEHTIDEGYLTRMDNEFMKFGVSGRTVLFASGDSGVDCEMKGGKKVFTPSWPSSSPYITSVGGTESTTKVWTSGGSGFSNYFAMPDYQADVVKTYVAKLENTKQFNTSGRAYPDVSAFATDFIIIEDGTSISGSGTSCSTPTFAGIVTSLNDVRLNKGLKTLGFLNPLLYQTLMGQGFTDIMEGSNGGGFSCEGFKAGPGWDAATGWGTPNFGILKGLV